MPPNRQKYNQGDETANRPLHLFSCLIKIANKSHE